MNEDKDKWYFRNNIVVIALLSVGPLALPLVWFNPRFSKRVKISITCVTIILTGILIVVSIETLKNLTDVYHQLEGFY